MSLTSLEKKYAARRNAHKVVCPVLTSVLKQPIHVTLPWGVAGKLWQGGHHTGEDHACPVGSLVVAVTWGRVVGVGLSGAPLYWGSAYGNMIIIQTKDNKYQYAYCHLSKIGVRMGQTVVPGEIIGRTGATGHVTGPHLHFECRPTGGRYGSDINPIHVKRG